MSIQWTIAAGFLYSEMLVVLLLVLPIASARTWQKIFRSRFLAALGSQTKFYFGLLLCILVILFLDAIREMTKYGKQENSDASHSTIHTELQTNLRLFRSQRNFYISLLALFLSLVIYRLCALISCQAVLQATNEATLKQAQSASATAKTLLSQTGEGGKNEAEKKEIEKLNQSLASLREELKKEQKDKEAIKSQAQATNAEYDRLTAEYAKLEKKLATAGSGDKKDD